MRGKTISKRKINADPRYQRQDVAKFINYIMERGKKSVAQNIVYNAFDIVEQKTKQSGIEVFDQSLKKVGPSVEIRGRRVGGANYQIPFPVRDDRRFTLACRWMIGAAQKSKGKRMAEKLADIIMQSANNEGAAIKKKEDTHRMAEANRAFAHFAKFG